MLQSCQPVALGPVTTDSGSVVDGPLLPKMAAAGLSRPSIMASSALDLSREEDRRRTFDAWPPGGPTPSKMARAGFYYVGPARLARCFRCGVQWGDWSAADSVVAKHRQLSPGCLFLRSALGSGLSSDLSSASEPASSPEPLVERMKRFEDRLQTFASWPLTSPRPESLANAGFYFLGTGDNVKCAFCHGVIQSWEAGDVPLREHSRHFPCCPFVLDPALDSRDECGRFPWHTPGLQTVLSPSSPSVSPTEPSPLTRLGISLHAGPKHPSQASPDARTRSFAKWPRTEPPAVPQLVVAGFFYIGLNDYTKCFHCDGGLCNWEPGDNPWEEHARWFPKCQFVLLSKGEAFVRECVEKHRSLLKTVAATGSSTLEQLPGNPNMEGELKALLGSSDVQFYVDQGVPRETLRVALLSHMHSMGRGFVSREELIQVLASLFSLHSGNNRLEATSSGASGSATTSNATSSATNTASVGEPNGGPTNAAVPPATVGVVELRKGLVSRPNSSLADWRPDSPSRDPNELELENLRLREQRLCKICLDADVGVVFLPCGHLVACPACAASVKDCPVCRKQIVGAVRTYLS